MSLLPWHKKNWKSLEAAIAGQRLPHALLLHGAPGLGKLAFAEALLLRRLCEAKEGAPCGTCRACRLLAAGNHPDLHRVQPEEGRSIISVDQIRALSASLSLHSHQAGYKCALVAPAEAMNVNAANSLLKTLEEPAADTLLLLVSARPASLPATISSRCQRVRFVPPGREDALAWLREQDPEADWESLLAFARGAPLEARRLAGADFAALDENLAEELEAVATARAEPVATAGRWSERPQDDCLLWLQQRVEDLVRVRLLAAKPVPGHSNVASFLQSYARDLDLEVLFNYLDQVRLARRLLEGQVNARLVFETLLIPWTRALAPGPAPNAQS